jgi:hypothetical protein
MIMSESDQSQTQTQSAPAPATDPAFVPSPLQPGESVEKAAWQTDEFKQKVAAAGFPGSPLGDESFLAALYKFANPS